MCSKRSKSDGAMNQYL